MADLKGRYETETGNTFPSRRYIPDLYMWYMAYTQWLECRLLKLERSIRGVMDLLNITDAPIPPMEVK